MQRAPPQFSKQKAPSNYVAGVGRGAIGFTTRSDIGPARTAAEPGSVPGGLQTQHPFGQAPKGYIPGFGRGSGGFGEAKPNLDARNLDGADYSETNFDQFQGFKGSLFSDAQYDEQDKEADKAWNAIDERMDGRRKKRREEKLKEALKKYRKERPKISDQFADLKQGLKKVSYTEWDAIPEANTGIKRKRLETFQPVSDSMLADKLAKTGAGSLVSQLDDRQAQDSTSNGGTETDLTGISAARDKMLRIKLDKMSDSVSGQTVVDPQGYLTNLNSMKITSGAEVGDIKKARLLLKSVTTTNRKHAPGWIAAARMEEVAGRIIQARKIIKEGCTACPESEDVWIEAARLNTPSNAKVLLANAVNHNPKSVKIWIAAADLEGAATTTDELEKSRRKAVLRRALEYIPNSLKLWQAAIELEDENDAKIMLARAVECVPQSTELWLALARLETYKNAKIVLNKARHAIPADPRIWVAAAQLNEANGQTTNLHDIMTVAVREMSNSNARIDRETWLHHAREAEMSGSPRTCAAITKATMTMGVEEEDRERTWSDDAVVAEKNGCLEMAREVYKHLLEQFPTNTGIWLKATGFERKHGTKQVLIDLLKQSIEKCPDAEILWLMTAKEIWMNGNVTEAREILERAFKADHNSEAVWLAAVKLVWESGQFDQTRVLLERARHNCSTSRVWMKSALLEWECNEISAMEKLLEEATFKFSEFDKLWLMSGQQYEAQENFPEARKTYLRGIEKCRSSIPLWLHASRLEEKVTSVVKARSVLELARVKNPKNAQLWLEAVRLERRACDQKMADAVMAKALQQCPDAGELWAELIEMTPRAQQKAKSNDALKHCDNDPMVIVAVAKLLWRRRKYDKARKWFHRAITLNPDYGDAWATYYRFELEDGTKENADVLLKQCIEKDPHHGERWCSVRKTLENRRKPVGEILKLVAASMEA